MRIDLAASSGAEMNPPGEIPISPYFNPDLAPTSTAERKWRLRDVAALWVAMAACVPTYMLASSLIDEGMNWRQAVLTIFLTNIIVLAPMILYGHAGTKYGIPFPVYCRAAFGIRGANVPALLRALVACGWFGIDSPPVVITTPRDDPLGDQLREERAEARGDGIAPPVPALPGTGAYMSAGESEAHTRRGGDAADNQADEVLTRINNDAVINIFLVSCLGKRRPSLISGSRCSVP